MSKSISLSVLFKIFCFRTMPRGSQLNEVEEQRIIDLKNCGKSQRQIASSINRSQCVVKNFQSLELEAIVKTNDQDSCRDFLLPQSVQV